MLLGPLPSPLAVAMTRSVSAGSCSTHSATRAAALMATGASGAVAAGGVKLCIPVKEGAAVKTAKAGKCPAGYTLQELGAEGREGAPGKQGPEGTPGKQGPEGTPGREGPEGKNAFTASARVRFVSGSGNTIDPDVSSAIHAPHPTTWQST